MIRFAPLVFRQMARQRLRTVSTVSGVAVAVFLFCGVRAMQRGVDLATRVEASDATLVVYRENRYCPFTSQLPQFYQKRIASISGVRNVTPMRVVVSNCRASLDVVTFRGVPEDDFEAYFGSGDFALIAGSIADWRARGDAAVVGEALAARRGIDVGERFSAAGITVHVAGILRSDEPQDRNVVYTHLPFLQESQRRGGTGGVVTQFNVRVDDPGKMTSVARAIDEEFARDTEPTTTWPEKAFVARAASDVLEIVRFASWLGYGALIAVFALVANAIVLAVRDRVREHAILQTLGYSYALVGWLVVVEGAMLGVLGGVVGSCAALFVVLMGRFSLTMEGLNIEVTVGATTVLAGVLSALALGVVASLVPAIQASRREIVQCFRTV